MYKIKKKLFSKLLILNNLLIIKLGYWWRPNEICTF